MLVKCLDYLRNKGEEWQGVHVYGQEINGLTSSIARMNLYLNGVEDFSIACADTLSAPAFTEGSKLKTFDVVLANPPYSIKEWNRTAFEHDKWGRNFLGTPPQARADYAFIQHILKSMNPETGRCAILLPHGVLFRKEEKEIRQKLFDEHDLLTCVIGIGPNLFYNSPMEACILIFQSRKSELLRNKVFFINGVKEVTRKNGESYLERKHIDKIADALLNNNEVDRFSRIVDVNEIRGNDYSLNISLYVNAYEKDEEEFQLDFNRSLSSWERTQKELDGDLETLINQLN